MPIACVEQVSDLGAGLTNRDVDAVIWSRSLPSAFTDWLDGTAPDQWPQGRFVLRASDIASCLADQFAAARIAPAPALNWFAEDVARLAECVRSMADTPLVRLRLEPIFDDACSKFHIDNVVARLICTYSGPGTQLALEAADPERAERVATGVPILLKGKRWPGPIHPVLRHRSPPISGTGEARLLVVLEGCTETDIFLQYDQIYPRREAV